MGGTTTKASIIEAGQVSRAKEYEVGAEVSVSSRLVRGSGYLLRMPVIDVSEVGAGGGSLAGVDVGGALRVGPHSAGAVPGPACYGHGNERPTVTDANLVLGYLHAGSLAGGALTVDRTRAERAVADHVAGPGGLSVIDAAYGIHEIANSNMVRAIKTVSVERGRDPVGYVLMAFGGAGPIHAAGVARALGMRRVLVPPAPGLFSAFGLLRGLVEHHTARTVLARTDAIGLDLLADTFAEMRADVLRRAREEGFADDALTFDAAVDLRYAGQSSEITVPFDAGRLSREDLRAAEAAFEAEYERTYGHRGEWKAFELVNCRLVATVRRAEEHDGNWRFDGNGAAPPGRRPAWFGPDHGMLETPILSRGALDLTGLDGPAIIEEYDSTIVVPPGCRVRRDVRWNVLIDVPPPGGA
jgi:N-methylhydantoinase A